ncbi:MAG: VCBS repeat-containing protein [Bryobacteraceae bacterium]|jgi:VCBS repeat protein
MTATTFWKLLTGGLALQMLLGAATPPPISFFARRDTPIEGIGGLPGASVAPPSALTVADFNGDGLPDVAVLSSSTNALIVFLGQGNGSFKAGKTINAGLVPAAVVAGDFNGDGKQDLAVVSLEGTGILLGNGDGTFQPLVNIRDAFGNALAVADFNGDGKLDLIAGDGQFGTLDLMLGNGDGTFQPVVTVATVANVVTLAVGDLNGDGKPDLIAATGADNQVVTILNKGAGTFALPEAFSVPGATSLATGDFNGDGKLDVACGTLVSGDGELVLLLGEGNGKLESPTDIVSEGNPTGTAIVAAGDFNGDGHLDLAASLTSLSSTDTLVLLGNGDGTFQKPSPYAMGGPVAFGVADFNGDGKLDLLTANSYLDIAVLSVLLGEGSGEFQVAPETALSAFSAGANWVGLGAADLNGDGLSDFVVAESTGAQVLLGAGNDQLTAGQFLTTVSTALALGDVNGDGHPDLIMTTSSNNVAVMLGNGDGTFGTVQNSNAGAEQIAVAIGDFNGDGKPDLAVIVSGELGVMLGDGTGNFAAPTALAPLGNSPTWVAVGDFDNDGKLDAVVANYGLEGKASISVLLGNGNGTFQPQTTLPALAADADPSDVEVADLNGDGNLDIVSANNNESYLSVYLGNGNGTFQQPTRVFSGAFPLGLRIADFNGDGIPDLVFTSQGNYNVGVAAGKGDGTFEPAVFFGANSYPYSIAVGTLSQGGKPGVVLVNNGFLNVPPVAYTVLRDTSK